MTKIEIYTKDYCPYCTSAKQFLINKGFPDFIEIDVTNDQALWQTMFERSGGRKTVPQIFIDGQGIGGYDDMVKLDKEGKLSELLKK